MNFPIYNHVPELESFCVVSEVFSPKECDAIIEIAELLEFQKGRVGNSASSQESPDIRDSTITWLHPTQDTDWIHHKISQAVGHANYDKFQAHLECFDGFQYTKYGPSQFYGWHVDMGPKPMNGDLFRKVSASLMLTDPSEYKGGDFVLSPFGNQDKTVHIRPQKGDLVVFYSFIPHKVEPVTEGERVSLVTWALGPKFK